MRRLILILVVTLGLTSAARAQDFEAAGRHFSAAQEAFGAKHFKTAAAEFEAAYGITKDPVLLYNIAESYEKAGDGHKAVAEYTQYLHDQPNAQDKAEVQKRIKAIQAKNYRLADQSAPGDNPPATTVAPSGPTPAPTVPTTPTPAGAAPTVTSTGAPATATPPPPAPSSTEPTTTQPAPPTTPPAPSVATPEKTAPGPTTTAPEPAAVPTAAPAANQPPPGLLDEGPMTKTRVGAWIGVATTLAFLTAGAIFGLAAQSRADEITRRLTFVDMNNQPHKFDASAANDLQSLKDDGNLYNGLAIGFYSVAAASAVTTVVLFVVDAKHPHPTQHALRFGPTVDKSGAGLALGGTF